jgi:REP-associated tyrosine transposase
VPDYRRLYIPGGTFFFTVTLKNRASDVLTAHIEALRQSWRDVRARRPFETPAAVVLPDHTHFMMTLPEGDHDYSTRIRLIKAGFTKCLPETIKADIGQLSEEAKAHKAIKSGATAGATLLVPY